MDAEVVVPLMVSKQILREDAVMATQSCFHKSCIILQQVRQSDAALLMQFCQLLKADHVHKTIGELLEEGTVHVHM